MTALLNQAQPITMTSLELVDFINDDRRARAGAAGVKFPSQGFAYLQHADFLKKVPDVLGREHAGNFSCMFDVVIGNGAVRQSPGYRFPKREACLMAMSYSYELQAKVFDRMTALESVQAPATTLPNFADPVAAARAWADEREVSQKQQAQLEAAKPKVAFVDTYVQASSGSKGFRQVCKLLNANENEFRAFLKERDIMYRLGNEWTPRAHHIAAGRFEVKARVAEHADTSHAYNQALFTPKGVNWVAAEWAKHRVALVVAGKAVAL